MAQVHMSISCQPGLQSGCVGPLQTRCYVGKPVNPTTEPASPQIPRHVDKAAGSLRVHAPARHRGSCRSSCRLAHQLDKMPYAARCPDIDTEDVQEPEPDSRSHPALFIEPPRLQIAYELLPLSAHLPARP